MKIIAYYLPQFHPIPENNEWWGTGFTEWTNVGKATKLFSDHEQPNVPRDLGYYDLRLPETRILQAKFAKQAGVDGFCYWHYWFGDGKRLLELPFNEVVESGEPDFPFCLGWANESWKAKVWNSIPGKGDRLLIEQKYLGKEDFVKHFYSLVNAFKDPRYMKVNDKPIFLIYRPLDLTNSKEFISIWNSLARLEGVSDGFHFIGHTDNPDETDKIFGLGFNAVNIVRNGEYLRNRRLQLKLLYRIFKYKFFKSPLVINYKLISKYFINEVEMAENVYPSIIPNWDHTPRSGKRGVVFHQSTPELFIRHAKQVFDVVSKKKEENQIVFLKSWNEWGEGNYMEPDLKHGTRYIEELGKLISKYRSDNSSKLREVGVGDNA